MADGYEVALFLHILGVFGIAGASVSFWIAMSVLRRIGTVQEMRSWTTLAVWSDRGFPVASVLVLAAGAYMVEDVWSWGDGWINTSLIALVVMGAGGGLLMTPRVRAIQQAAASAADGPVSAELRRLTEDPILWGTLCAFTGALLALIWNMTTKPGDAQSGMVLLAGFVAGAAASMLLRAREG